MVGVPGRGHDGSVRAVREQRNAELAGRIRREDELRAVVVRQGDAGAGDRLARVHRAVVVQVPVDRPTDRLRRRYERDVELGRRGQRDLREVRPRLVERLDVVRPGGKEREVAADADWKLTVANGWAVPNSVVVPVTVPVGRSVTFSETSVFAARIRAGIDARSPSVAVSV